MSNHASKKRRYSLHAGQDLDVITKRSKITRSESVNPTEGPALERTIRDIGLWGDRYQKPHRQSQGSTIALVESAGEPSTVIQGDDTTDDEAVPDTTPHRMLTSDSMYSVPESPPLSSRRQKPMAAKQPRSAPSAPHHVSTGPVETIMLECRTSDDTAYFVNLPGENVSKHNDLWTNGEPTNHVRGGTGLLVGDVVRVSFGSTPGGYGKIVEIRTMIGQKHGVYIVVQWLYRRSDAMGLGLKGVGQDRWRNRWYMLSNHFQVITRENIASSSREYPLIETTHSFDACMSKSLRPSAELEKKLEEQLGYAVPRPYRGHVDEE